ncbi:MAG: HNH endonuclease [Pseudolabrys sp.]|nr:HNH endonuclease [Pseudolabrys sp.]
MWRIASHQSAKIGDRIFIFKQGANPRGVFGVGQIVEAPRLQPDPADVDKQPRNRAKIQFDALVDPSREFLIGFEIINEIVPQSLIDAQASGNAVPSQVAEKLEAYLNPAIFTKESISSNQADTLVFDPDSIDDQRERSFRAICVRRGQAEFRASLLEAYGRRCAITGCAVEDVLEAAHITPYLGPLTNHVTNGLLLRSDLHTLFDCGLLAVEPEARKVVIAETLSSSSYAKLNGRLLRAPKKETESPSKRNLEKCYASFKRGRGALGN